MTPIVNFILSSLTILGQGFIIFMIILVVFFRKKTDPISIFLKRNAIPLAFIVSVVATMGSLYYSEIAKFTPCELCWFQRIFMYPQVLLLGLAWWKKDEKIVDYSLAMVACGLAFSIYHNYIYYFSKTSPFCSLTVSCTQRYFVGFNYISISLMALTAFTMVGLLLLRKRGV